MNTEYNIFILWHNGRNKEEQVLEEISQTFEIVRKYEICWTSKFFIQNLARFYGKKLPNSRKKLKLCGLGNFLIILVEDKSPEITAEGKNQKMQSAKYKLRQLLGDNYLHASDNQAEAEENLYFLLGKSLKSLLKAPQPKKLRVIKQDLAGTPTWLDEDKFAHAVKFVSGSTYDKETRTIHTPNRKLLCRILNARKILLSFKKDVYSISIRGRNEKFKIKKA